MVVLGQIISYYKRKHEGDNGIEMENESQIT
jgi:hypothetical protein